MSFARTKIQPPRSRGDGLIERPELEGRVGAALLSHRLVLVAAAAGYGKTAALTRQIQRLPPGTALAWVSADEGDDLHRLLDCLVAALEPIDPPWRSAPEALVALAASPQPGALQSAAAELLNTLDASEVPHGVIVFDDLHRVDDAAVFAFIDLLLAHLSPRWTIAIAARHDPPLALARLRALGELAEFRQSDLQFARSEARDLAARAGLDAASADALLERTQGWAVGLRLALNSARGGGTRPGAIDRHVFEFLATEVLDRLRPELRDFLLRTSVLTELSAERCTAVTGHPRAAALLAEIERLGLFASTLAPDDEAADGPVGASTAAPVLRLHDLFREALEHRLALQDPAAVAPLLQRAAASEDDPVRRLGLLLRAGDLPGATDALQRSAPGWLTEGALATVARLLERFPAYWRERSPALLRVAGLLAWARWDFYAMAQAMQRAELAYRAEGDEDGAQAATAYQSIALSALGRIDESAPRLATLRRESMSADTRGVVLVACIWHALDLGSVHRVGPLLDELMDLVEGSTDLSLWYRAHPISRINGLPGTRRALDRYVDGVLRLTGDTPSALRGLALTQRSWREAWDGRLDEALASLEQARADAHWLGDPPNLHGSIQLPAAVLHALRGDHAAAQRAIRECVDQHLRGRGDWSQWGMWFYAARIATSAGDAAALREALGVLRSMCGAFVSMPTCAPPLAVLAANLDAFDGRHDPAIRAWEAALADEPKIDRLGLGVETRLRLAAARLAQGRPADAARVLTPALDRVAEHGGVGAVLLARAVLPALANAPWGSLLAPSAQALLRVWAERGGTAPAPAVPAAASTAAPRHDLSERELEVLERIALGDSNKLIARAFDLSPHTVKRHVANILDKLGVASRGQAAAWYRAHG